jgi:hypothetical protein
MRINHLNERGDICFAGSAGAAAPRPNAAKALADSDGKTDVLAE